MRILGIVLVLLTVVITCLFSFNSAWKSPHAIYGLLDTASLICFLGLVIGGSLIAYGSELGLAFKTTPTKEEAITAIGVYKLAVRISIGSGFIATTFGLIGILQNMGNSDGLDIGVLTGGLALAVITILYGLISAFTLFLSLQYYFQYQLDNNS